MSKRAWVISGVLFAIAVGLLAWYQATAESRAIANMTPAARAAFVRAECESFLLLCRDAEEVQRPACAERAHTLLALPEVTGECRDVATATTSPRR